MKKCLQAALLATSVCTIGVSSVVAETKKPQKIQTPIEATELLKRIGEGDFRKGTFELNLHGFGRVKVHLDGLNEDLLSGNGASTHLFKGSIERIGRDRPGSRRWVAGSVFSEEGKLSFDMYFPLHTRAGHQHYLKLEGEIPDGEREGTARVRRMPAVAQKAIDSHSLPTYVGDEEGQEFATQRAGTVRTLEIAVEGEGVSSQSTASILNAVDSIYQEQLGIKLSVKSQKELAANHYSQASPEGLLEEFRQESTGNNSDVSILLTSKRFASGTAGVAFAGVVCRAPRYSYGLATTVYGAATPYITAHEIGHTLGADHDDGIMSAVMSNDDTSFTQASRRQIDSYLQQYGSCLASGPAEPVRPTATPVVTATPVSTPIATPRATPPPQSTPVATPTPQAPTSTPSPITAPTIKGDIINNKLFLEVTKRESCDLALFGGVGSDGRFKAATTLAIRNSDDTTVKFTASIESRPADSNDIAIFAIENCEGRNTSSRALVLSTSKIDSENSEAPYLWVQKLQQKLNGDGKSATAPNPFPTATPRPGGNQAQDNLSESAAKVVHDLVNQHRRSIGLTPLRLDDRISLIAQEHSEDIATGTVPPGHQGFNLRVDKVKEFMTLERAAENVAWFPTAEAAVEAWLGSPAHRGNIEGDYTTTGIGVVRGDLGLYFTQLFFK